MKSGFRTVLLTVKASPKTVRARNSKELRRLTAKFLRSFI
jgi:hypothetical protein